MWWRLKRSDFDRKKGSGTKRAFKRIVKTGPEPGILAYAGGEPVGWCAIAPREDYPALDRSRVLKRVDDQPVWSVTCFFIARGYRRQGLSVSLLKSAIAFAPPGFLEIGVEACGVARRHGAWIVEGYPVEPRQPDISTTFAGLAEAFRKAGFAEVARRSETRPIMRYAIGARR